MRKFFFIYGFLIMWTNQALSFASATGHSSATDQFNVCLPPSCCLEDSECHSRDEPICNIPSGHSQGVCWGCSSDSDCAGKPGGNYCLKHPGDATGNCVRHQHACWTSSQCSTITCDSYTFGQTCLPNADGTGYGICVSTLEMTTGITC